jgi:hypothetical protein
LLLSGQYSYNGQTGLIQTEKDFLSIRRLDNFFTFYFFLIFLLLEYKFFFELSNYLSKFQFFDTTICAPKKTKTQKQNQNIIFFSLNMQIEKTFLIFFFSYFNIFIIFCKSVLFVSSFLTTSISRIIHEQK